MSHADANLDHQMASAATPGQLPNSAQVGPEAASNTTYEHPIFGEVISAYSRQDAFADGSLVDVAPLARQYGFRLPVAVTKSVWGDIHDFTENSGQDATGRNADVLMMASLCARGMVARQAYRGEFKVHLPTTESIATKTYLVNFGAGDAGEPVITIGNRSDF